MIKIQVMTFNDMPPKQPLSANFDELGGKIGRAEGNTLVLPDPERGISRIHASISFQRGQYFICSHGSALPVYLNDQPLSNEQDAPIVVGDIIRIGEYVLQVMADEVQSAMVHEFAFNTKESLVRHDHASDGNSLNYEDDPFGINSKKVSSNNPPPDFDPFEDLFSEQNKLPNLEPSSPEFVDVLNPVPEPKEKGSGITEIISPKNPLLNPSASSVSVDPLIALGDESSNNEVAKPSRRDDVPELKSSLPQRCTEENASIAPSTINENTAATKSISNHEELLHAFLTGAGVPNLAKSIELTPQLMYLIGQLLRESTQGTLDLLQARMLTKKEMRAEMTMIAPKENNPLKFSPNVEAALDHLLAPKVRGFMSPLQAMKDTYDDLRSHQFGFMAGMRAALSGVLERFNPVRLEQRLAQKKLIDSVFPVNRKAKLWSLFTERYGTISQEAQEDFHVVFGKEFLRAYEEQIAKLEKGDKKR